jgi:hypothetical protein
MMNETTNTGENKMFDSKYSVKVADTRTAEEKKETADYLAGGDDYENGIDNRADRSRAYGFGWNEARNDRENWIASQPV